MATVMESPASPYFRDAHRIQRVRRRMRSAPRGKAGGDVQFDVRSAILILLLLATAGCSPSESPIPATRNQLVLSSDLGQGNPWLKEAKKRFGENVFLLYCHGGPAGDPDGRWWLSPQYGPGLAPTHGVAVILHALMPDRDIVFISCNEAGSSLGVARCYYCRRKVLSRPEYNPEYPDCAWSIWEFVCDVP
jgi:hypothetical protein